MKPKRQLYINDNLPILRCLDSESVDLIYLDPPFNSGKDWAAPIGGKSGRAKMVFKDTWTPSDMHEDEAHALSLEYPETVDLIQSLYCLNGGSWYAYLIYMAARLVEMRRILKPSGSIYYHCDPVMSHGIKLVMDSIFGLDNFCNEIIWKKTNSAKAQSKTFGNQHDIIFYYSKSANVNFNKSYISTDAKYLKSFKYKDDCGEYQTVAMSNTTGSGGFAKMRTYEWRGVTARWIYSKEKMDLWWEQNLIVKTKSGYRKKHYLHETNGNIVSDIWDSGVSPIQGKSTEYTRYPTQKPLALLERIINASSNEGDIVLDPFCGCGTTLLAAQNLKRQWIGIDISQEAVKILRNRLPLFSEKQSRSGIEHFKSGKLPMRTDLPPMSERRSLRARLYKLQRERCAAPCGDNGNGRKLDIKDMELDHIRAKIRGGQNVDDNMQLLCGHCNRTKGADGMTRFHRRILENRAKELHQEYCQKRDKKIADMRDKIGT